MPNVKFHLKAPNPTTGESLIYLQFNYHGERMIITFGETINPEFWDADRQLPIRAFKNYKLLKEKLSAWEDCTHDIYAKLSVNSIPSKETLSDAIKAKMNPLSLEENSFHKYAMEYIEAKKNSVAKSTYQNEVRTIRIVNRFAPKLTFDQINKNLMMRFRDFLFEEGYKVNYAAKTLQRFKSILTDAVDESRVEIHPSYKSKKVMIQEKEATAIFLDVAELERMYALKLTGKLESIRDNFLILAFTGARFCDMQKISKANYKKELGYFHIVDQKTGGNAYIPAHPIVMEILEKRQWKIPKYHNKEFNLLLKDIAKMAGYDETINVTEWIGEAGRIVRKDFAKLKWELVTAHTGRRSLVCNMLIANHPAEDIMNITGHRSYNQFKKYVKLTPKNLMDKAAKSEFYQRTAKEAKAGLRVAHKKTA
jgi:hypothetical protein